MGYYVTKSDRVKAKHAAEQELRENGYQFSYLTDAYNKPNMFTSTESKYHAFEDERPKHFKMFRSKAGKRFIVVADGTMYYLTH